MVVCTVLRGNFSLAAARRFVYYEFMNVCVYTCPRVYACAERLKFKYDANETR